MKRKLNFSDNILESILWGCCCQFFPASLRWYNGYQIKTNRIAFIIHLCCEPLPHFGIACVLSLVCKCVCVCAKILDWVVHFDSSSIGDVLLLLLFFSCVWLKISHRFSDTFLSILFYAIQSGTFRTFPVLIPTDRQNVTSATKERNEPKEYNNLYIFWTFSCVNQFNFEAFNTFIHSHSGRSTW